MNSYSECKAIVELDLDPIKVKLMHKESGEGWSLEQANVVEAEYRRYLYLMKAFPNEAFAPGTDVDTFWHYHILDTIKYAADCQEVFGYFVHHFPYIGLRGEEDLAVHERLGERMRTIYEAAFGEPYRSGRLVSFQAHDGAFAAKAGATAFSASPVGVAAAGGGIAFSASPVGVAAAGGGTAFSASPVGARAQADSKTAFSASPGGTHAVVSDGTAFSASPVGARAAAGNGTAFSASPVGTRTTVAGDTAFSASPVGQHAPAGNGAAFSASPVDTRAAASKETAFSASAVGKAAAAQTATAFSASPVGARTASRSGIALHDGPVYMSRLGPAPWPDADACNEDSPTRPGDDPSSVRPGNADGESVASDDLFSIRPRLPEPIAA